MGNQPLDLRRQYIIKHTTQSVKAQVRLIRYRVNVNTLERQPASELNLNEIGTVVIDTHSPLFVDQYRRNRMTGSFVMVDPISNATVAAGMVTGRDPRVDPTAPEAQTTETNLVPAADRQKRVGHAAVLVWLNGGANLAYAVERELFGRGYLTHVIAAQTDGSVMLELAHNMTSAGLVTICAADFLYEVERERAAALIDSKQFVDLDASLFASPEEAAKAMAEKLAQRGITPGSVNQEIRGGSWLYIVVHGDVGQREEHAVGAGRRPAARPGLARRGARRRRRSDPLVQGTGVQQGRSRGEYPPHRLRLRTALAQRGHRHRRGDFSLSRLPRRVEIPHPELHRNLYAAARWKSWSSATSRVCTKRLLPERSRTSLGSPTRTSLPRPRK